MDSTRRAFLAQSAGALGILFLDSLTPQLLAQAHEHARAATSTNGAQGFRFLTKQEASDFEAFSAQIIPADETPGAREAGAVYFADYVLSTINQEQQQDFRSALALLRVASAEAQPGTSSFAALSVDKQIALMIAMDKTTAGDAWSPAGGAANAGQSEAAKRGEAFGLLRATVLVGTFSDPSLHGNRDQIGWKLIGFDDQAYWAPPFGYYDAHAEDQA